MTTVAADVLGSEIRQRCDADPDYFSRVVLGRQRWSRQLELRNSVFENRRTICYSANGVGKTFDLGSIVCEWLVSTPGGRVVCTGPKFDQVKKGLWSEVRRAYSAARQRGVSLGGRMGTSEWILGDQWDASVMTVDNVSAIQGLRGSTVLIVIDEAQGVVEGPLWDALESLMTAEGSRLVASGNPLHGMGRFFELAHSPDCHVIQIDGYEHPNVVHDREIFPGAITRMWVDERKSLWGPDYESDPRWQARVRGRFPDRGTHQVVSLAELNAVKSVERTGVNELGRIGVDVARYGDDSNVLVYFDRERRLCHVENWKGEDTVQSAGRVRDAMRRFDVVARNVKVDVSGVGAGVVDRLKEDGAVVDSVDFGSGAKGDWPDVVAEDTKFANRRAELHWVMRHVVRRGLIEIPDDTPEMRMVRADLVVPAYAFDGSGAILVEKKEAIKKRIGRSPDFGDAAIIALSNGSTFRSEPEYGMDRHRKRSGLRSRYGG